MSRSDSLAESDMAAPVMSLFSRRDYAHFEQVPLGRKKIDLVFLDLSCNETISVELKIADWKRALWQAQVNFQISTESYIAIWHEYLRRTERNIAIFREYGVGIIIVDETSARVHLPSTRKPRTISHAEKPTWYRNLIGQPEKTSEHAALSHISTQRSEVFP